MISVTDLYLLKVSARFPRFLDASFTFATRLAQAPFNPFAPINVIIHVCLFFPYIVLFVVYGHHNLDYNVTSTPNLPTFLQYACRPLQICPSTSPTPLIPCRKTVIHLRWPS